MTAADNRICAPIHAPTSGVVSAITDHPTAHPSGLNERCVIIEPDGKDEWCELTPDSQWMQASASALRQKIREAGITGLGGASFPTAVKLDPPNQVQILLINGAECEPYITADDVLMRHYAAQICTGIAIMAQILDPKLVVIAIEENKPEAIAAMKACCEPFGYQVRTIPTKYPSGGERQLIRIVTGREVPSGSLPADIGVVVHNTGTAYAVQQAIELGKPLIERVVTVTGQQVQPHTRWTLLGTPVSDILDDSDYQPAQHIGINGKPGGERVIMGGPMMGFTLPNTAVPITKISNCLLAPAPQELPNSGPERPCIRCSACADACPAGLLPQQLYWFAKSKDHARAQSYRLQDCIECGACAYVCPSQIPLVHYYRKTKAAIRNEAEERGRAEQARLRFEARQQRQEEEKAERLRKQQEAMERQRRKREQAAKSGDGKVAKENDAVAAALARVKARKAKQAQEAKAAPVKKVTEVAEVTEVKAAQTSVQKSEDQN